MIRRALLASAAVAPVLLLAVGMAVILRAVILAPEKPRPGGQYTEGIVGPLGSLNPLFVDSDDNAHDVAGLLFDPLLRLGSSGGVETLLAARWEVSEDQLSYTVALRPEARWSDGSAVTTEDVVFTVRTVQDPQFRRTVLQASWKDIIAKAIDPAQVRFTLPGRNAGFLATVSQLDLLPAHLLAGLPADAIESGPFGLHPVGTGSFRLVERVPDGAILERNPFAWRRPWLARIVVRSFANEDAALQALARGQVDALANLTPAGTARARQLPHVTVHSVATYRYAELLFNLKPEVPYFQDRRVRRAIALSVDRSGLISGALGGEARPADGPIPRAIAWAFNPATPTLQYDPGRAESLLNEAGWVRTENARTREGVPLRVQLVVGRDLPPYQQVARKVAADLQAVGIQVDVIPVGTSSLVRDFLSARAFQIALTAVDNGPDPDVFAFWHSSQARAGGLNFVSMKKNVFLDKDLEDGRATLDQAARARAYYDLQEIFAQEVPGISLYSPTFSFAVDRRIRGVRLDDAIEPVERYAHAAEWYIVVGR